MTPAAIVFAGPSLAGVQVAPPAGVVVRPPAEAGDVYRAARAGVRVIGLVDGVFEDRPTVWHKEILWALARGTRVLGAASLGALRAVECARYGMEGVGAIFARCRDGEIEDDHELAVAYAPAELGFAPISEPLVNVRATLGAAVCDGVLSADAAATLLATAEALPYKTVTWRRLAEALSEPERAALEGWLPLGRVDLKRADALALLDAVASAAGAPPPAPVRFAFAETRYWQAATVAFDRVGPAIAPEDAAVLDELRLDPVRYARTLVRAYASRAAGGTELPPDASPETLVEEFRAESGLDGAEAFRRWCDQARTTPAALAGALAAEERLLAALEATGAELAPAMLDALRADGRFAALSSRAADKHARLADTPTPAFREAELPGLVAALSARVRARIDTDDPDAIARAVGLADRRALHRLLAREAAYGAAGGTS